MQNIALLILSAGLILAIFALLRKKEDKTDDIGLKLILEQINELNRTVDAKIGESSKQMSESVRVQLGESAKLIRDVTEGLTKLDETNKQVVSFADQLQNLQDILKNPKQRGILGEYYLETLLKNVLTPAQYKMQYAFSNGEIVDAVVFVKDKIIPIDSKVFLRELQQTNRSKRPK
jgi:DNA recombination protein RmuC